MSGASPDPYELLGVARDATDEQIRAAFRHLARVGHPDAEGTSGLYRALVEARDTLLDPSRRRRIDRGEPAVPQPAEAPPATSPPQPTPEDAWAQVPVARPAPGDWMASANQGGWVEAPASPWLASAVDLHSLRSWRSWPPGGVAAAAVLVRAVESSAFSSPGTAVGYVVGAVVVAVLATALWPLARSSWARRGYRHGVGLAVVVVALLLVAVPAALPAFIVLALIAGVVLWRRRRVARR